MLLIKLYSLDSLCSTIIAISITYLKCITTFYTIKRFLYFFFFFYSLLNSLYKGAFLVTTTNTFINLFCNSFFFTSKTKYTSFRTFFNTHNNRNCYLIYSIRFILNLGGLGFGFGIILLFSIAVWISSIKMQLSHPHPFLFLTCSSIASFFEREHIGHRVAPVLVVAISCCLLLL